MSYEPFDVVVLPFPFTDRTATKRRPALVISAPEFNAHHDQLVLAMITTARGSDWPSDVLLEDWTAAGLGRACRVRLKVFTLDKTLVVKRAGALSERDQVAVRGALSRFLAVG